MEEQQKKAMPALCPKCNNTGQVKKKDGSISICFDCLLSGRLDQHGDKTKMRDASDYGIKL